MGEFITPLEKVFAQQVAFAEIYGELPSKRTSTGLPLYPNDDPGDKQTNAPVMVNKIYRTERFDSDEEKRDYEWKKIEQIKKNLEKAEGERKHLMFIKKSALIQSKSKKNGEFFKGFLGDDVLAYIGKNEKGKNKKNELRLINMFVNKPVTVEFVSSYNSKKVTKQISGLLDKKGNEKPMTIERENAKYYDLSKVRCKSDFLNLLANR